MDSGKPRKLEPGLAAQYSMPSDLMTSTMKSEPGRSLPDTVTAGADVALSDCTLTTGTCAASNAAPVRNLRRSNDCFFFAIRRLTGSESECYWPRAVPETSLCK